MLFLEFLRQVAGVARDLASTLSRSRARGVFLMVVAATAACCVVKRPIQQLLGGDGREPLATISRFVWRVGDGTSVALIAVLLVFIGEAWSRPRLREAGMSLAVAGVFCFAFTKLGQFVFAEARPSEGGAMHFFAAHGHGFSGHASASAVLFFPLYASVRAQSSRTRVIAATLLVAWMVLVGFTRVWTNQHFVWNVMAGWATGLFAGHGAARYGPCTGA